MFDVRGLKERLHKAADHGLNNHDALTLLAIYQTEAVERMEELLKRFVAAAEHVNSAVEHGELGADQTKVPLLRLNGSGLAAAAAPFNQLHRERSVGRPRSHGG